jgi:hypothetical protein
MVRSEPAQRGEFEVIEDLGAESHDNQGLASLRDPVTM